MRKILSLALLINFLFSVLQAQVKIGDNPTQINVNSLLELESTNKGLLPPRVALQSISSTTPLTSSTPAGMLVYSSGGLVTDGYYTWSGTKWLSVVTSVSTRANHVVVKSASDFPAASGGVITLSAGVLYEVSGTVSLSNMINLNGATIIGADATNDRLIYTGGSALFTGSGTGGIRLLTLSAASGSIFNINAGNANKNLLIQNCYIIGCNSVGTIQGVGGTVFMQSVAYFSNVNGITFTSDNNVVLNQMLWDVSNSNTYEKFTGSFNVVQLLGGDRLTTSANSAKALDITGLSSLAAGNIRAILFTGTGTNLVGTFSNSWEVESTGLNTEKDDVAAGNLYISTPLSTTFAAVNTPVKIQGTTTAASLFRVSSPVSNRLMYTGAKQRRFSLVCSLTSTQASNNTIFTYHIFKNGVSLPESKQIVKMNSPGDQTSVTLSCTVLLSPNDYIEVFVENNTGTNAVDIKSLNLAIK